MALLFGDVSPSGRTTTTWYSEKFTRERPFITDLQLAPHQNIWGHAIAGITYRFYNTSPVLWPFGHGLSYTTFHLQWGNSSRQSDCTTGGGRGTALPTPWLDTPRRSLSTLNWAPTPFPTRPVGRCAKWAPKQGGIFRRLPAPVHYHVTVTNTGKVGAAISVLTFLSNTVTPLNSTAAPASSATSAEAAIEPESAVANEVAPYIKAMSVPKKPCTT